MKQLRTVTVILLLVLMLVTLCSCSGGISRKKATEYTDNLFTAVAADNWDEAVKLFHPDRSVTEDYIQSYIESVEAGTGADFSSGIEITAYKGFSSSLYNSEVDGSKYEINMKIAVGDHTFNAALDVVRNDSGEGIYDFYIAEES